MHKVLKIGKIYCGTIQKVIDFGLFIRVDLSSSHSTRNKLGMRNCEGLVHVSQIRFGRQMLERAQDSGYEKDDRVWAKLTQIRKDGKLNFTMKECD